MELELTEVWDRHVARSPRPEGDHAGKVSAGLNCGGGVWDHLTGAVSSFKSVNMLPAKLFTNISSPKSPSSCKMSYDIVNPL